MPVLPVIVPSHSPEYRLDMRWTVPFFIACLPVSLAAHPHVFVDTGLELIFDDEGRLTHVRVEWAYDEFYSLMLLEEMRLDNDMDGVLTEAEEGHLAGFDAEWVEGYNGDLVMRLGGEQLELSGPMEPTATTEQGRIVSTHTMVPCGSNAPGDCPVTRPGVPYRAALEVAAGTFAALGVEVGDCVAWPGVASRCESPSPG